MSTFIGIAFCFMTSGFILALVGVAVACYGDYWFNSTLSCKGLKVVATGYAVLGVAGLIILFTVLFMKPPTETVTISQVCIVHNYVNDVTL